MIKTQVQLPDDLYRDLKELAKRKEWSLAETLRRGGEQILELYPHHGESQGEWRRPKAQHVGWKGLSADAMHRVALDDMERRLP